MGRLIIVSNRLPITVRKGGGGGIVQSVGGLVSAMGPVHERGDSLWLGSVGPGEDKLPREEFERRRLLPVALPRELARRHYEGFSNGVIWPQFHYFLEEIRFDPEDFNAYRAVNERFADVIAQAARPDDTVWIHDYHFMLLPAMLRRRLPRARIGFFLHIPFPSSEVFRVVPVAEELLRGLLGADLVGVHTYDYARHLTNCFRRLLGVEFDERMRASEAGGCCVGAFPIGVDAAALRARAARPEVQRRLRAYRERAGGRKVVLGVDRMDYSKGLVVRLDAYRRLLDSRPEWRERALFVQVAVPSRSNIPSYQTLKEEVDRHVGEINGAFGRWGTVPIQYLYRAVPPDDLAALYQLADVALVTPLRDGMNLVAKEYVASRPDDSGVLVLSRFAGSAWEMGEALLVNPWDTDGTARALDRALRMGADEQRERMAALARRVRDNDVHRWRERFLAALAAAPPARAARAAPRAPAAGEAWRRQARSGFARASRALIVLDYDGTLSDLVPRPEDAAPDARTRALLGRLAAQPGVQVALVSGRTRDNLAEWLGDLPVHIVAEHGYHLRLRGEREWRELGAGADRSWIPIVRAIMDDYSARTPGAFAEEKAASLAWHYRQADRGAGTRQARELAHHLSESLANSPLQVLHGACVVEVRPQGVNKGAAWRALAARAGPFDFVLAAGDDRTDEDLFAALPEDAVTVKIGAGASRARYRLESPAECKALLDALCEARKGKLGTAGVAAAGSERGAARPR